MKTPTIAIMLTSTLFMAYPIEQTFAQSTTEQNNDGSLKTREISVGIGVNRPML